jgi:hypothetical protein
LFLYPDWNLSFFEVNKGILLPTPIYRFLCVTAEMQGKPIYTLFCIGTEGDFYCVGFTIDQKRTISAIYEGNLALPPDFPNWVLKVIPESIPVTYGIRAMVADKFAFPLA